MAQHPIVKYPDVKLRSECRCRALPLPLDGVDDEEPHGHRGGADYDPGASLTFGGPELMGRTVGNLVGVQPDYVMVTRFPFFENMVDDIGTAMGVTYSDNEELKFGEKERSRDKKRWEAFLRVAQGDEPGQ